MREQLSALKILFNNREPKAFVDHLHARFIEKRRLILEIYLQCLIHLRAACEHPEVMEFLGCS
jgi:hypothetical protein